MKVTKKEQWAPMVIELESAEELMYMEDILRYFMACSVGTYGQEFASKLHHNLMEVSK